ncbi:hypothetical protein E4U16_006900 [Claviceps sp. LM84 group G4]|nr:hypothetical protein E4U16_006900 [Claviceps sp. LM84 group G4]KAG6084872.1 hypothetical protein E4U33_002758 [Claviceps sp. LM78 group G4]
MADSSAQTPVPWNSPSNPSELAGIVGSRDLSQIVELTLRQARGSSWSPKKLPAIPMTGQFCSKSDASLKLRRHLAASLRTAMFKVWLTVILIPHTQTLG